MVSRTDTTWVQLVVLLQPSAIRHAISAIALGVSILHFWYDGFIWSVRRKEV